MKNFNATLKTLNLSPYLLWGLPFFLTIQTYENKEKMGGFSSYYISWSTAIWFTFNWKIYICFSDIEFQQTQYILKVVKGISILYLKFVKY
jgi:hypothetical protein